MYQQLKIWASTHQPLERSEELAVIANTANDTELFEIMLQHNARMIIKEISRWSSTYDLDDASSIVICKLWRNFDKWDHASSFYYFANLRIKGALHEGIRKYKMNDDEDIADYCEIIADNTTRKYDDTFDHIRSCLTDSEYNMIESIYKYGVYVKNSDDIASTSRKHQRILSKLRDKLGDSDNI